MTVGKHLRELARDEIMRRRASLKTGPALLLLTVADKVRDDHGVLYASDRKVAGWIGRSQPTMRKYRAQLVALGLIERLGVPRPGVASRWQVLPDPARVESPSEHDLITRPNNRTSGEPQPVFHRKKDSPGVHQHEAEEVGG